MTDPRTDPGIDSPLDPPRLDRAFFARPTLEVARDLVGRDLVHHHPRDGLLTGRIVETEGYTQEDPAFHGWRLYDPETGRVRPEGRAFALFGEPGTAYVYKNYGIHWLVNVVTDAPGVGGGVLIRAVEPLVGREAMAVRRPKARRPRDLTNGPGKLTQAFDIDGRFHGRPFAEGPLYFAAGQPAPEVATSSRIGLTRGVELPWRYFVAGNPYVSPGRPSDTLE